MSAIVTPVAPIADAEPRLFGRRMAAIVQVQRTLASSDETPEELMRRIPALALSVVEAAGALFELVDGDSMVLIAGTAAIVAHEAIGLRFGLKGSLSGEGIRLNGSVRCDETEGDPRVAAEVCRRYGLRSVLVTVIRDQSGPIGVLKLVALAPGYFGEAETDSIELVAEALGAAIQRKRADDAAKRLLRSQMGVIQLQQEVAASPTAGLQSALQLIAGRAQQLTNAGGATIFLADDDEMVCRAGSGTAAHLLLRRYPVGGSLIGLAISTGETLRCDDTELDERVNRAACREMGFRSMMSAPLRSGAGPQGGSISVYSARTKAFSTPDVGTLQLVAEWLGVVLQRGTSERQLRDSESQYRRLFAAHALPMWIYDIETLGFLAVNDSAVAQYGYSRAEFLSMTLSDLRASSSGPPPEARFADPATGSAATGSAEHRRKDGTSIDVEASDNGICFEGRAARVVLVQDVTERKRVERRIQKSEALLRIAGSVARVGGWSLDFGDGAFSWTDEMCSICDLPPGTPSSARRALSFGTPASRRMLLAAFARTRLDGTPYDLELELLTACGRRLWVRCIGQVVRNAAGAVAGVHGAVQDISERREAAEKVRVLAASLKTTLESITGAFYTLDRDWRFTYVNAETERLKQRSSDELMGRRIWDAFPDLATGEFARHMRAAVERQVTTDFEIFHRPWGKWLEFHAYPSESGLTVYLHDITERRSTQARLLLLEACVASMQDVVIITEVDAATGSDTRIVFVNEAFVRQTGYSRAEALGGTPWMLQGANTQRLELDRISRALRRREGVRAELISYTKAGAAYWVDLGIVPVWSPAGEVTHFVAVIRDATERRVAQEALRSLNDTLEAKVAERTLELERSNEALVSKELEISSVIEHMADGVISFDDHGTIRAANPKVEEIFGQTATSLLGRHISLLIPTLEGLVAKAPEMGEDPATTIAAVGRETYGRKQSGEPVALDVAISDFCIGGQRLWTATVRDISERLRILADLEQARLVAEEASSAKSAFVATMSHEIRTPMNGVIGMIDVLHQTPLAPDQSRMLGVARDSAHALLAIIDDILDFSKIEAGRLELERAPLSPGSVVEKACALMRSMASGKGVELVVQIDPRLPLAVWGDAGRLRQIVVNLVSNAIKFSARSIDAKVSVRAHLGHSSADRVTLQLEVEDNGIGMEAATIERLFLPFSQADVSTTRRFGGTGLGLAISHHLVELMGGDIDVRSTPAIGSVFSARLPFFPAPGDEPLVTRDASGDGARAPTASPGTKVAPTRHAFRVLVAEDNEINQLVITEQLARLGYAAVVVPDGREALALWRGGGFDALLTDLQMPEMDGYELAATIRAEEGGRGRMPILALTANALKEEASRCKASGMDDYLSKPVRMHTLDEMLKRWLTADAAPVDARTLPSLIGDDPSLIGEFMLDFIDSATQGADEMAQAVAAAQGERFRGVAHRLKSAARAVGAIQLGELCDAIENESLDGDGVPRAAQLVPFDIELERVRRWIGTQGWTRAAGQSHGATSIL